MRRIPQTDFADGFAYLLRIAGQNLPEPIREYRFMIDRDWRFDFAWPRQRVALEVNGGRWKSGGGRHAGDADYWKLATAAAAGWRVLPVSPTMLDSDPWRILDLLAIALSGADESHMVMPPGPCSGNGGCGCTADEF